MRVTRDIAKNFGFQEVPHFTIGNNLTLDVGRNRYLSLSDLDNCNCMLYLCERSKENPKEVTDLINLHNWDYDKQLTVGKLENILKIFNL